MKNRLKVAILIAMLYVLVFGSVAMAETKDQVIAVTLEQIENPNPDAMAAYTQLTGQPDEYMTRLYESLNRLTER